MAYCKTINLSVYKVMKDLPEEWVKQLNIYGYILQAHGEQFNKAEVVAILRDWSVSASQARG